MERPLTVELVQQVLAVVSRHTRRTPLLRSEWLSSVTGRDVFLKCENLQRTGSFKLRGALAALEIMGEESRAGGVVTASAGNHGLGLARAAAIFQIPCKVVVSRTVPRVKEEGIRAEGAEVIQAPHDGYDDTEAWTLARLPELGGEYVSPFEDTAVMAGNGGTLFLEIQEDLPEVDTILVPCGGGGLIVGLGFMGHQRTPPVRVIGVNSDASPGMWRSREDGRAHLAIASAPTIAEGIEGGVCELTYRLGQAAIDDMLLVPESTIRSAVPELVRRERLVVEGAGAAGVAAVMEHSVPGDQICVVLTGSNIDMALLVSLLEGSGTRPNPETT